MSFDNKNAGILSRWVILGILGLFLLFFRQTAKNIVYAVFGIGLMLAGAASVYGWWQARKDGMEDLIGVAGGIAMFIVGLWIMRNPGTFDRIINMIIGIVLVVSGVNWINRANQGSGNKTMYILSIVSIVVGIIIAFSHAATNWVVTACGIALIYTAATGFIGEKVLRG